MMAYEWDGERARRSYLLKVGFVVLSAIITSGLPVWMVVKAIG